MKNYIAGACYAAAIVLILWGWAISASHEGSIIPFLGWAVILAVIGVACSERD